MVGAEFGLYARRLNPPIVNCLLYRWLWHQLTMGIYGGKETGTVGVNMLRIDS